MRRMLIGAIFALVPTVASAQSMTVIDSDQSVYLYTWISGSLGDDIVDFDDDDPEAAGIWGHKWFYGDNGEAYGIDFPTQATLYDGSPGGMYLSASAEMEVGLSGGWSGASFVFLYYLYADASATVLVEGASPMDMVDVDVLFEAASYGSSFTESQTCRMNAGGDRLWGDFFGSSPVVDESSFDASPNTGAVYDVGFEGLYAEFQISVLSGSEIDCRAQFGSSSGMMAGPYSVPAFTGGAGDAASGWVIVGLDLAP